MKRPMQQLLALERFHDVLKVSTIAEPIESASSSERAQKALETMKQKHFDVLALSENGEIVGYVAMTDLEGRDDLPEVVCGTFKKHFCDADLVQESCPLGDCLRRLQVEERLFVHGLKRVDRIVTRADLHKQPVRMLIFSVISLLEMALLSLIRKEYPDEQEWRGLLSKKRLKEAEELLRKREKAGMEIDLIDCLQLGDKGTIVKKTKRLRLALGFDSNSICDGFFGDLEKLRNALAHGQAFEAIPRLTLQRVFDTFQRAQDVLKKSIHLLEDEEEGEAKRAN